MAPPYMGNYPQLQATSAMTAQPGGRDSIAYPPTTPGVSYFSPQTSSHGAPAPATPDPGPSQSRPQASQPSSSFVPNHVMASVSIQPAPVPVTYGGSVDMVAAMAGPQPLHRAGSISAGPVPPPGYGLMHGYVPDIASRDGCNPDGMPPQMSAMSSAALDVVFPNQRRPPARRGPFQDPTQREQTAQTRRIGSCIRCRMQRIRVSRRQPQVILSRSP